MKTVWAVVALVVIVASLGLLARYYASAPEPGEPVKHRMPVACEACGKAYIAMVGKQPAKCEFCGEKAAWRATQCVKCGAIIPVVGGSSFQRESPLRCPKCGGQRFKEVSPDAEGLETP